MFSAEFSHSMSSVNVFMTIPLLLETLFRLQQEAHLQLISDTPSKRVST